MSKLKIRVLGALSFLDETGAELALTRKNRTVLAAIVLAGDLGLTREKLAVLFWGDRGEKQAQASVRQALAAIRKGLGPFRDCLQAGPDHLAVNGQRVELDAEAFETLAASPSAGDGDRALALYRGNLLEGIRLKEEDFEAWLRPMRERLRGLAVSLLEAGLEAADDKPRTIALALRLLELEAINEPAHRALIRTYAAQGRDDAALKQFERCRDLLEREMGILPSRQTAALFDEISSKRGGPAPSPGVERDSPKRTKKPTIVIMPLENLSSEPGQAHITAGITQDIIAALLRHRWLSVINAANMVSAGRFAMVEDGQVVEANADYLLTGTLRKAGDRLRINVQMTATASREYIWSESYDGQLGDIFGVQDEITTRIASHIDIEVGTSERQRVLRQANPRTGAWDCYHLGMTHFLKSTSHDHLESQRLFARSMEIDDQFGEGLAWWSYASVYATFYFDAEPTAAQFERALEAAQRAVRIDDQNADFHMRLARVYLAQGEHGKLMRETQIAMVLNPNQAGIYCGMGDALNLDGQYAAAMAQFEKALRLGPRHPNRWAFLSYGALTHLFAENFVRAVDWSKQAMTFPHCKYWAHAHRAAALGHLGEGPAARRATAELLKKNPVFTQALARKKFYFLQQPGQLTLYLDGLAKAGVPA